MDMDAKARSKMTLSTMTEQDRKMDLGAWSTWDGIITHRINYILKESISSERPLNI